MRHCAVLSSYLVSATVVVVLTTQSLRFLDVERKILENGFESLAWRKPFFHTGVLLNFNAICPKTWTSGLIMRFLHRAKFSYQ